MSKLYENGVLHVHLPSSAQIEKEIIVPGYGVVALILDIEGNKITYFHTDFLQLSTVGWDQEKFSKKDFHEELPEQLLRSINENHGFFLSKHFLAPNPSGKVSTSEGYPFRGSSFKEATSLVSLLKVPEMIAYIPNGILYDTLGMWLINTGTLTKDEWLNSPTNKDSQKAILTKDHGGWSVEDLLGNIFKTEWTSEQYADGKAVTREGTPFSDGEADYVARKRYIYHPDINHPDTVIRVAFFME